jgi:hypothetical protein
VTRRWGFPLILGLGLSFGCSEEEPESGGPAASSGGSSAGGAPGGSGGRVQGVGGGTSAGGSSGAPGAGCGACGENACKDKQNACAQDPECQKIRACVYGQDPGCAFGEHGAGCAERCLLEHCTSDAVAKLFLEAELCAYCGAGCQSACADYCGGFSLAPETVSCPNLADAGADGPEDAGGD